MVTESLGIKNIFEKPAELLTLLRRSLFHSADADAEIRNGDPLFIGIAAGIDRLRNARSVQHIIGAAAQICRRARKRLRVDVRHITDRRGLRQPEIILRRQIAVRILGKRLERPGQPDELPGVSHWLSAAETNARCTLTRSRSAIA